MDIAVIIGRTPGGKLISGEAAHTLSSLQPKFDEIRKAGKMGKEPVNKVMLWSTWTPLEVRDCTPAVKG